MELINGTILWLLTHYITIVATRIRHILHAWNCSTVFALLVFRYFGHAARHPEGRLIRCLVQANWRPAESADSNAPVSKTWNLSLAANDGERTKWKLYARLRMTIVTGVKSVRDVVNSIGDAGLTRPEWTPTQVHEIPHIFIQIDGNTFQRHISFHM